jgi:hypothetical protein
MREVKFISDFASKKKGDVWRCDSMLASQLVNIEKVAEYNDLKKNTAKEDKPKPVK